MASQTSQGLKTTTSLELRAAVDVNRRLFKECYAKCVHKVADMDLAIGEMSCVDRCVPKYMEVHQRVADEFKKLHAAQTAAAAAGQPATQ